MGTIQHNKKLYLLPKNKKAFSDPPKRKLANRLPSIQFAEGSHTLPFLP